jgi:hypothetical protein
VRAPAPPDGSSGWYVGTFIGERLLYLPSIGFCLLLADALETFRIGDAADKEDAVGAIHATASSPPPPPLEYGGGAGTPKKAVVAAAKALADEKVRARWVRAKSSLGDAKSSLGDVKSSLGYAKSSLGDAESSLGEG